MSFLRPAPVDRAVRFALRYSTPVVLYEFLKNGSINPIEYLVETIDGVEDAGLETEQAQFDVQSGITVSIPPSTVLELDVSSEVSQSPQYQLIRSIPRPEIPTPSRPIGNAPVTRFNQDIAISLAESINERKFGCLLHEPINKNPVQVKECTSEQLSEQEQDNILLNFALWLGRGLALSETENVLDRVCDLSVIALSVFTGPGIGKIITLIGCKAAKYYLLDQVASNLTALSIGVQSTVPTGIEYIQCDALPVDNSGNEFELCTPQQDLDTCFVPIRNLRSNLPGGEGYKTQLQIVFSDAPDKLNDLRQLTISSPIDPDSITKELILETLYGFSAPDNTTPFKFGEVKYEADVVPYGYIRYYGIYEARPYQSVRNLFTRISNNLVNGSIDLDTFRPSDRARPFTELDLYPVKALLFDFSNPTEAKCNRWDLR